MIKNMLNMPHFDYYLTLKHLILLTIMLVFVLSYALPVDAESEKMVRLSNSDELSYRGQLIVLEDEIYVLWQDDSTGDGDIYFSKISAENFKVEPPINLSNNDGKSAFPRFSVQDDKVFTTWYDYTPGLSDIYFGRSIDGGKTFETFNISQNKGVSYNPWIAASGKNLYIVWNDDTRQNKLLQSESKNQTRYFDAGISKYDIILATSHNNGSSFEKTFLSAAQGDSINPRITASENNVYVIWTETKISRDIILVVSTDGGVTFNEPVNVSNSQNRSDFSAIQVDDNRVHTLWIEETSPEGNDIFYAGSDDNGLTFSTPINLSQGGIDPWLTRDTQMVVSDNEIYLVWYENSETNSGVFFVKSIDGGKTFSQPINLSGVSSSNNFAQIAKHDDNIYIIWTDAKTGSYDVYLRKSTDGGDTFSSIVNLSNDDDSSNIFILGPQIVLTEDKVFTIFHKKDNFTSNLYLKVFSQSQQDAGTLFLQTLNGAVDIQLEMDKNSLDVETPSHFTIKFNDPETGESLDDVNYSFSIEDLDGNKIVNNQNQLAETGTDIQSVQFSRPGSVTVIIDVNGIGTESPNDTKYTGTTSAVITVVPEFPLGVLAMMIPFLSLAIILSKMTTFKSRPKKLF